MKFTYTFYINIFPAYSSSLSTTTIRASTLITNTSSNPHYPFTAPYKTYGSQRRHSVSGIILF